MSLQDLPSKKYTEIISNIHLSSKNIQCKGVKNIIKNDIFKIIFDLITLKYISIGIIKTNKCNNSKIINYYIYFLTYIEQSKK